MNHKRIDLTQLDGLAVYQDTLEFFQEGDKGATEAMCRLIGDKIILTGVVDQGANVTNGWIIIGGELLPFVGGAKAPKVWIEELNDVELFGDSSTKTVYYTRRARMGNVGAFDLTELRKFKTDALNINDSEVMASAKAVKKLQDTILAILSFETEVILKGCEVSNVDNLGMTFDVAPGVILIDGNIVNAVAYSGAFPAYLLPDGTWDVVAPGGSSILFDPYTSQRHADVIKRATTSIGEVKMFKTLSDRFDAISGVGKWEMQGFKVCDDMQGRVPLGYDRRLADPFDNVWDANYNTPGNTGGEKKHQLTVGELPAHRFFTLADVVMNVNGFPPAPLANTSLARVYNKADGSSGKESYTSAGNATEPTVGRTNSVGNNEAHNNIQPYRVMVYVERI